MNNTSSGWSKLNSRPDAASNGGGKRGGWRTGCWVRLVAMLGRGWSYFGSDVPNSPQEYLWSFPASQIPAILTQ